MSDQTIAELQWFFRDASADAEVPFLLAAIDIVREDVPRGAYDVRPITKMRTVRNALLALSQDHADVLSWAFEVRDHHPRIRSLFSWPGIAVRTAAARRYLAEDETEIVMQTADVPLCRWPLTEGNEMGAWADMQRTFDYSPAEIVTGDHDSGAGMVGFLLELKAASPKVRAIRDEVSRRFAGALAAYQEVRRQMGRSDVASAPEGDRRAA